MTNETWKKDATVKHWFTKIGNERTIKNYTWEFPKFLEFIKMEPKDIVQQRLEQLATTDQMKRRFFEDKYVEYKHILENAALKKNTVKSYLRTVQSFFANNNVKLILNHNDSKVTPKNREDRVPTEWIPSNEDVRVLYRMAKESRDRSILLVLYQSGFSEVDVGNMCIEDFPFYDKNGNWQIPLAEDLYHKRLREKTNILQQTCISREALEEIRIMLQSRGFPKEGYLFISFRGEQLGVRGINDAMKEIVRRAFNGKAKEWMTKHLRDSFMNACEKAKIAQEIKDAMVGHQRQGARKEYGIAEDTIKTLYQDAFKNLTVNGYGNQSRKLEEFNTKLQQLESSQERLIVENKALHKILESAIPTDVIKKAMLETAKNLHGMTEEKFKAIEDSLKMVQTIEGMEDGIQNVMKIYGSKNKQER